MFIIVYVIEQGRVVLLVVSWRRILASCCQVPSQISWVLSAFCFSLL